VNALRSVIADAGEVSSTAEIGRVAAIARRIEAKLTQEIPPIPPRENLVSEVSNLAVYEGHEE
jgi:hypothetical protein